MKYRVRDEIPTGIGEVYLKTDEEGDIGMYINGVEILCLRQDGCVMALPLETGEIQRSGVQIEECTKEILVK